MTDEKKKEYTRRISQANKSGLVVILYELFFEYTNEAEQLFSQNDKKGFSKAIFRAHDCLNELIASLNMEMELAGNLLQIYMFISGQLGYANGKKDAAPLKDVNRLMKKLYETYKKDSENDTSLPVMQSAQVVYAGLTYGKDDINESYMKDGNRGFLA